MRRGAEKSKEKRASRARLHDFGCNPQGSTDIDDKDFCEFHTRCALKCTPIYTECLNGGFESRTRRSSAPFVRDCGVKRGDGLAPYYEDGSPSGRLRECPFAVCHCSRNLTRGQVALPNTLQECGVLPQFPAVELVGVEDAHWKRQLLGNDSHRLSQIRIVRYEHRNFEPPGVSVA